MYILCTYSLLTELHLHGKASKKVALGTPFQLCWSPMPPHPSWPLHRAMGMKLPNPWNKQQFTSEENKTNVQSGCFCSKNWLQKLNWAWCHTGRVRSRKKQNDQPFIQHKHLSVPNWIILNQFLTSIHWHFGLLRFAPLKPWDSHKVNLSSLVHCLSLPAIRALFYFKSDWKLHISVTLLRQCSEKLHGRNFWSTKDATSKSSKRQGF